jgi:hypothetical protein
LFEEDSGLSPLFPGYSTFFCGRSKYWSRRSECLENFLSHLAHFFFMVRGTVDVHYSLIFVIMLSQENVYRKRYYTTRKRNSNIQSTVAGIRKLKWVLGDRRSRPAKKPTHRNVLNHVGCLLNSSKSEVLEVAPIIRSLVTEAPNKVRRLRADDAGKIRDWATWRSLSTTFLGTSVVVIIGTKPGTALKVAQLVPGLVADEMKKL